MQCPECGATFKAQPMTLQSTNPTEGTMKAILGKTGATGSKLKSLRPTRVRPEAIRSKGSITRGGRYSSD